MSNRNHRPASGKQRRRIPDRRRWLPALGAWLLALAWPTEAATLPWGQCPYQQFPRPESEARYTLVIIIDDIGYQRAQGQAAVQLPGKINYAVLPFTPYGKQLARQAYRRGKEVLLHAPMSNRGHKPLGRGALTPELSRDQFDTALAASLEQVPYARGVNNHMGSDLTRRRPQMRWLMQELAERGLYFVDSRTDKGTVAATVAGEQGVPHLSRQVFLDNTRTREAIAERFAWLTRLARERGLAVAIGHPYPETIAYLQEVLPHLQRQHFRLALVSEVLSQTANGTLASRREGTGPAG